MILIVELLIACKTPGLTELQGFIYNDEVPNFALIIGSSGIQGVNKLDSVERDVENVRDTFTTIGFQPYVAFDQSYSYIEELTRQIAASAHSESTLLIYYSGHAGVEDTGTLGLAMPNNVVLPFEVLLGQINSELERHHRPDFKRLIVLIDACNASAVGASFQAKPLVLHPYQEEGMTPSRYKYLEWKVRNFQIHSQGITTAAKNAFISKEGEKIAYRFYEDLLVFSSSGADQFSRSNEKMGGLFTTSFLKALDIYKQIDVELLKRKQVRPTIKNWIDMTIKLVSETKSGEQRAQTPVFDGINVTKILNEELFLPAKKSLNESVALARDLDCETSPSNLIEIADDGVPVLEEYEEEPIRALSTSDMDLTVQTVEANYKGGAKRLQCWDKNLRQFKMKYFVAKRPEESAFAFKLRLRIKDTEITSIKTDLLARSSQENHRGYYAIFDASEKTNHLAPFWRRIAAKPGGDVIWEGMIPIAGLSAILNFQLCKNDHCRILSNQDVVISVNVDGVLVHKLSELNKFDERLRCRRPFWRYLSVDCSSSDVPIVGPNAAGRLVIY